MMNRREALAAMMGAMGLATTAQVFGASALLGDGEPASTVQKPELTSDDIRLLNEIGETILPETPGSPGAKAAKVGEFMREIVRDYYTADEQLTFVHGLKTFREYVQTEHNKDFSSLDSPQRQNLLLALEKDSSAQYYQMMKQLTIWGYFSSEAGTTKALRYAPIPGRYDGDVKIKPGAKAWANG